MCSYYLLILVVTVVSASNKDVASTLNDILSDCYVSSTYFFLKFPDVRLVEKKYDTNNPQDFTWISETLCVNGSFSIQNLTSVGWPEVTGAANVVFVEFPMKASSFQVDFDACNRTSYAEKLSQLTDSRYDFHWSDISCTIQLEGTIDNCNTTVTGFDVDFSRYADSWSHLRHPIAETLMNTYREAVRHCIGDNLCYILEGT